MGIGVGAPLRPNHPQSHLLTLPLFGHKQWGRKRKNKKKQKGKGKGKSTGTEKDILLQKRGTGNGNGKHPAPADLRLLSGDSAFPFFLKRWKGYGMER